MNEPEPDQEPEPDIRKLHNIGDMAIVPLDTFPFPISDEHRIHQFMQGFPIDAAALMDHPLGLIYRYATKIGNPDKHGRQPVRRVRIRIETLEYLQLPRMTPENTAPRCENANSLAMRADNPDYYLCEACSKYHSIHDEHAS